MSYAVIIIDDSPLERFMTETLVRRTLPNGKITSFPSALTGLEYMRATLANGDAFPFAIFLDIYMPVMNGFDFLDEYVTYPEHLREQCKIIMFSSTENDEDYERMKKYKDIYKFIGKPLSDTLIESVSFLWRT